MLACGCQTDVENIIGNSQGNAFLPFLGMLFGKATILYMWKTLEEAAGSRVIICRRCGCSVSGDSLSYLHEYLHRRL